MVLDGNHVFSIMNSQTYENDTFAYAFPYFCKLDISGNLLQRVADSFADFNSGYTAIAQTDSFIFWAGWRTPKPLLDVQQAEAFVVKTDKNLNNIWRQMLPNHLRMASISQIKISNDEIFIAYLQWSPDSNNVAFPNQPVRTSLVTMDFQGQLLSNILQVANTAVMQAGTDFKLLDNGSVTWAGTRTNGNGVQEAVIWNNTGSANNWTHAVSGNYEFGIFRSLVHEEDSPYVHAFGSMNVIGTTVLKIDDDASFYTMKFEQNAQRKGHLKAIITQDKKHIIAVGRGQGNPLNWYYNGAFSKFNLNDSVLNYVTYTRIPETNTNQTLALSQDQRMAINWNYSWDSLLTFEDTFCNQLISDIVELPNGEFLLCGQTWDMEFISWPNNLNGMNKTA